MNYALAFGYYGSEIETTGISMTYTSKEPIRSLDKLVKFFNLENEKAVIGLDMDLVWQGSQPEDKEKIDNTWREIISKKMVIKGLEAKIFGIEESWRRLASGGF
jgi:hypothetical protein